jgi:hypothetical protein
LSLLSGRPARALPFALLVGLPSYLALHALCFGRIPWGLEGGPAVEALRGVRLVLQRKFEVMTFSIGPSAETLWLYVVGASVELLGPRWFSVVLPSILAATAVVALSVLVVARLSPETPPWVPLLLSAGSVWLFHYGQVGLRTIVAPLFLILAVLLVDRSESERASTCVRIAAGFILGLSLYGYSACRVLPAAWLLWKVAAWVRTRREARNFTASLGAPLLGFVLASVPNLLFFLREPGEFLFRGYYVYGGRLFWRAANVFWTLLLPFYHPRFYTAWRGEGHNFDATAVSLTGAGVHPIDPVTAIAFAFGLVLALRRPRRPGWSYLLWVFGTGVLSLGLSGPSLTRLLLLQPVYVLFASLGFTHAWRAWPRARFALGAALLVPGALGAWEYAERFGRSEEAQREYLPGANAMCARARDIADHDPGARVMLVARKARDIAKFYNYRHIERIWLMEYAAGTFDASGEPVRRFRPDVVLVERLRELAPFAAGFGTPPAVSFPRFDEYRLSRSAGDAGGPEPGNIRRLWSDVRR